MDNLSPEDRHRTMQAVKGKRTGLERRLRGMLAGMRLKGWTTNVAGIIGKPDAAFVEERVAVFANGCFWHGCPKCKRKVPQNNQAYWERKLARNAERDAHNRQALEDQGWRVVIVWEHELARGASRHAVHRRIRDALAKEL